MKFTSPDNSSMIELLISEFNKYKDNPDLAKYSKLVSKFLELLDNKPLLKELDDLTSSSIDSSIEYEFTQLRQDLKSIGAEKLSPLLFNEKIINRFCLIIYYQCYIVWFKEENTYYESVYKNSINLFNDNFHLLDNETTNMIIDITRFIPKRVHDNYMLNNKKLIKFMNNVETTTAKVEEIQKKCEIYKTDIEKIENSLKEQRQEFNFIGLSDAFQKMKGDKQNELKSEQRYNIFLRVLIAILLSLKLSYAIFGNFSGFDAKFAFISLSSIFLIAVLIYFFRISLMNIKSIKSQILQLDLRLSLCQFIHNYAEDSEKMRKDNMKDSLDRFESIIFSPIVANEEQIPTTFDNLDQFIKMMNVANGGKGETK